MIKVYCITHNLILLNAENRAFRSYLRIADADIDTRGYQLTSNDVPQSILCQPNNCSVPAY
jgi:hypothetical protein